MNMFPFLLFAHIAISKPNVIGMNTNYAVGSGLKSTDAFAPMNTSKTLKRDSQPDSYCV